MKKEGDRGYKFLYSFCCKLQTIEGDLAMCRVFKHLHLETSANLLVVQKFVFAPATKAKSFNKQGFAIIKHHKDKAWYFQAMSFKEDTLITILRGVVFPNKFKNNKPQT